MQIHPMAGYVFVDVITNIRVRRFVVSAVLQTVLPKRAYLQIVPPPIFGRTVNTGQNRARRYMHTLPSNVINLAFQAVVQDRRPSLFQLCLLFASKPSLGSNDNFLSFLAFPVLHQPLRPCHSRL